MFTINEGKKELERAFTVYRCKFCYYTGLTANPKAKPVNYKGNRYSDDPDYIDDMFQKPVIENVLGSDKIVCPNCGMGMDEVKFMNNKEYVDYLVETKVKLEFSPLEYEDYLLTEDDLYIKD